MEWDARAYVEDVVAAVDEEVRPALRPGSVWLSVVPPGVPLADHGWKLHVSARAADLAGVAAVVVPLLVGARCHFKLAASARILADLNEGNLAPATVGKAFTVYPAPDEVVALAHRLCDALAGRAGPRVLSDRLVREDAPVYYRYGPFKGKWSVGDLGKASLAIPGPGGHAPFEGAATMEYRRPEWVTDPFTGETGPPGPDADETLLGGRYRVSRGLYQAAKGNVFRGVDEETGREVVVKQARAYVGEASDGVDARLRLRNERRVLQLLADVPGVPEFLDHFAHGADEYLVMAVAGEDNLVAATYLDGRFRLRRDPGAAGTAGRRWRELAGQVARQLLACHERGIVMHDVTPRNVVVDGDRVTLIDFGIAASDGVHIRGGTPGYAPLRQMQSEEPRTADDRYALGMVLAYAATALSPVAATPGTPALPRLRMLQTFAALRPHAADEHLDLVADLTGDDEQASVAALATAARLDASGEPRVPEAGTPREPVRQPAAGADVAGDLTAYLLDGLLTGLDEHQLVTDTSAWAAVDSGVYTGSAGVGLELLRHLDRPGVPEAVQRLARHAHAAVARVDHGPGLLVGCTGTQLFLLRARAAGLDGPALDRATVHPAGARPDTATCDDLLMGAAGTGLGHLLLHELTGHPDDLDLARTYAGYIAGNDRMRRVVTDDDTPAGSAIDPRGGYAHGLAGLLDLLLGLAAVTGDPAVRRAAAVRADRLVGRAATIAAGAVEPAAVPLSVSWCQGLAGMVKALVRAADVLGERRYVDAAAGTAEVFAGWVPRLAIVNQCCGLAGIGHAVLDLAAATGEPRHHALVDEVVRQLLRRSSGPDEAPVFVQRAGQDAPLSWGMGEAGVLGFLRRVRDGGGPETVPQPVPEPMSQPATVTARAENPPCDHRVRVPSGTTFAGEGP